ncbi:MAG TPA: STAS domain-containing protein [Solirubrobacteraceae bacterium]|nr:STAS domain-containing protein [Solirubrobacteraceae bacterium]
MEERGSGEERDQEGHERDPARDEERPARDPGEEQTLREALRPPGPVHFAIARRVESGVVRLEIEGELDVLTTPRLASELDDLVRRSDDDVVVDLRGTGFIDSAGLQLLLGTQRRLGRASRTLTVICDDGPVRRVIELTRLDEALGLTRGDERPDPS